MFRNASKSFVFVGELVRKTIRGRRNYANRKQEFVKSNPVNHQRVQSRVEVPNHLRKNETRAEEKLETEELHG